MKFDKFFFYNIQCETLNKTQVFFVKGLHLSFIMPNEVSLSYLG